MSEPRRGPASPRGRLIVVSGGSGSGKSAVVERLLEDARFARAVTATTRAPRDAERDGADRLFLSPEEFERRARAGWFLEHAEVCGRRYGTPREGPEAIRASGRHCLLVLDAQGAAALRSQGVEATHVLLVAPGREEASERGLFDLVLVVDDLEATARKLAQAVGMDVSSSG